MSSGYITPVVHGCQPVVLSVNGAQASKVKEVLNTFERCTGQLISPMKCSILFAEHCPQDSIDEVRDILQVQQASFESKYLGLPTPEGRMKS
jgi:hypothetical protein